MRIEPSVTGPVRASTALVRLFVVLTALLAFAPKTADAQTPLISRRANRIADSLLAMMTIEEKLGQLTQLPAGSDQTGPTVDAGGLAQVRAGQLGAFLNLWGADVTRRFQRVAVEESRLHIPLLLGYDVIHGMRTIFPVPLAMAATFDSAAAARAARVAAVEATAMGVHWTFAPMVDIARDARVGTHRRGRG